MEDKLEARFQELEEKLKNLTQEDRARVRDAFDYARSHHEGQLRKDGSPYITHPLEVAHLVAELGLDADSIMAALLHDTIEDTDATHEEVAKRFSETVADLVEGVTKLTKVKYTSTEEKQMENLRKMLMAMAQDVRVILIKICDRVHNIRTLEYQTEKKQREKALETLEIYAPIAHRLGMQRMKWEMEDQSLKFLDPIAYQEISDELDRQAKAHAAFMEHIQEEITTRLEKEGIKGTVYGRVKHVYSIYRKMYAQNKKLSEIFDLYAFRVIVDDIFTCYRVLGDIHDMYRPVLGRFKDYISTPKPNMYQSLHTTVIGSEGIPFEVQIRTWEMHHMAEYGVAAHWKYKQGMGNKKLGTEETFAWVRRLLENQQDTEAEDFIKNIKVDLFADEVFVFTPKGDVVNMPAGATPIDLAYAIHSAVGNRMTGCKLNGRIAPIDSQLKNGDIVEILTSKEAHGPSRDWVKIVKTTEARNKIKQWFKKECREENIVNGKEDLDRELRANLLYNGFYENEEVQKNTLNKFSFNTVDELYAAIGYGGIMLTKVINKVKDDVGKLRRQREQAERAAHPQNEQQQRRQNKSSDGVVVEGIDNCLVKFARCCTPIPGDEIVGFVTRGYGVSIHRRDCVNVHIEEEPDRWVRAWWDEDMAANAGHVNKFSTGLQISTRNRIGVLSDVTLAFASSKINVHEISARDLNDGYGVINAMVDVTSVHQLDNMISRLRSIKGVVDVTRTVDTN